MSTLLSLEGELRQWFSQHHGVIARYEALRIGASQDLIRFKLSNGEWARMLCGVYRHTAVPQTPYQDLRCAWVATRGLGVVSHRSAGWLWGLLPSPPVPPELTVRPGAGGARRPQGLTIHRSRDLDVARTVNRQGVLVTNPLRTIVDLAGSLPPTLLTDAVDVALATRLVTIAALTAELGRLAGRGRPGVGKLRGHLLDRGLIGAPEPSVLEAKMGRIIILTRLPLPTVELHVGKDGEYRLDFAWADILFSIEVDGYAWHFTPGQQQRDHRRRNRLQEAGWTIRVYTWRDVCREPARVGREVIATYTRLARLAQAAHAAPAAKSSTI
ncbi:MAG: hypothetical protein M3083_04330 [Actinomycetota bacterium]|nr:hypothetical protein [Actinomycetota bacterium]